MMLEHLGHADAAQAVVSAIERVVKEGKVGRVTSGAPRRHPRWVRTIAALV
jgi:isocitrate/isopropylmalate dehydrogenase